MTGRRRCIVVQTEHGAARVQVAGKLTQADRDAVTSFARELSLRAAVGEPTPEQLRHRQQRHLSNLIHGIRGTLTIAKHERECALCDVPLRRGDEIVTCEGGMLCPSNGAWPCTIHAEHRKGQA